MTLTWKTFGSIYAGRGSGGGRSSRPTERCHRRSTWLCWGGTRWGTASVRCPTGGWLAWPPLMLLPSSPNASLGWRHKPKSKEFNMELVPWISTYFRPLSYFHFKVFASFYVFIAVLVDLTEHFSFSTSVQRYQYRKSCPYCLKCGYWRLCQSMPLSCHVI